MMKLSKALMLSVSGLMFTSSGSLASIHNLTSFNSPGAVTFVHTPYTHTSHPEDTLLSSFEDFLSEELSPYSYRGSRRGYGKLFKPTLTLPKSLGRGKEGVNMSSSDLIRGSRWSEKANSSDLDTPVKPEYDTFLFLPSPLRGRRKENNPVNCFLTTGAELLICTPATATEANVTVTADRSKLVLLSPQHLRSQTGQGQDDKIKTAATCFVTDTNDCSGNQFSGNNADDDGHGAPGRPGDGDDYDLDNAERCRQEGYNQTSCPEGQEPANTCPYDSNYFEECVSSCPSNYVTCEVPYYGVGEDCDGKYASCEKDTERACQELNPGYVDECGTGQQLSDDRCSYDSSYGTCCNTCWDYAYTLESIPDGYIQDGEPCITCDGLAFVNAKPNPCDGYMDCGSMGPDTDANSCLSGTTTKYDNCKPCPNKGTLTSCPSPYTCTLEACSNRYYKSGCLSGYDWNASSQTCTAQCDDNCPNGYSPTNTSECYDTAVTECGTICYKEKPCCRQYLSSETKYGCSCSCETSGSRYVLIIHKTKYFYDEHGEIIDTGSEKEYHNYFATIEECEERKSDLSQCNMSCDSFASSSYSEICE